jgi:hypothetical protein
MESRPDKPDKADERQSLRSRFAHLGTPPQKPDHYMQHPGEPIRPRQRRPLPGADDPAETRAARSTRVLIRVPQVILPAPTSQAKSGDSLANRPSAKAQESSRTVGGPQSWTELGSNSKVPAAGSTENSNAHQAIDASTKSYRVDAAHTAATNTDSEASPSNADATSHQDGAWLGRILQHRTLLSFGFISVAAVLAAFVLGQRTHSGADAPAHSGRVREVQNERRAENLQTNDLKQSNSATTKSDREPLVAERSTKPTPLGPFNRPDSVQSGATGPNLAIPVGTTSPNSQSSAPAGGSRLWELPAASNAPAAVRREPSQNSSASMWRDPPAAASSTSTSAASPARIGSPAGQAAFTGQIEKLPIQYTR